VFVNITDRFGRIVSGRPSDPHGLCGRVVRRLRLSWVDGEELDEYVLSRLLGDAEDLSVTRVTFLQ